IKATQKDINEVAVIISPKMEIPNKYKEVFDYIIEFPWDDLNFESDELKFRNEWKIYHCSPFEETIKIESDMLLMSDISH
ncbi:hypothetical protein SB781_39315, partial [Paraburkholderia sp. SIMBA_061]